MWPPRCGQYCDPKLVQIYQEVRLLSIIYCRLSQGYRKTAKGVFLKKISDRESNNHSCLLLNNIVGVKYSLNLTYSGNNLTLAEIPERFK